MGLFSSIFGGGDSQQVEASPIPVPDPNQVIGRQAQVNRVNQTTPFGNLTFSGPDRSNLDFSLSPDMQRLLHQQTAFGRQSTLKGRGLLSAIPGSGDAAVNAQLQRLQPGFDLQDRNLRERLEQSGNPAAFGSAAMSEGAFNELGLLNQSQNDARLAAVLQGPAYQGGLINNALALGSGSPVGVPQFNFQGASPIDVMGGFGLQQNANIANQGNAFNAGSFNAGQAGRVGSDIRGGLFDIGSSVLGGFFGD